MNFRDLILRARALFLPKRAERDLHDELQFHIELETRKLIDKGMTADEARIYPQARRIRGTLEFRELERAALTSANRSQGDACAADHR